MPNNGNTDYNDAAQLTVDLVDHGHTPDRVSEAVLETLIEMSADCICVFIFFAPLFGWCF